MGPRKRPQHPSDDAARAWTHKPTGVRDTCVTIGKRMLVSNFTAILVKMSDPLLCFSSCGISMVELLMSLP